MKDYIIGILIILLIIGGIIIYSINNNSIKLKNNWSVSEVNYKASNRKNLEYKLTIDQLKQSKDSNDIKLMDFAKRLKLKDSKIKALMSAKEYVYKTDTIQFKDTIFSRDLKLDTIIGDKWVKNKLHLEYPGEIIITDSVYNEKNIAWSNKRETINPPKKFFLFRWFQSKQTIVEVTIEDLNPHFKTKEFKYNIIIK